MKNRYYQGWALIIGTLLLSFSYMETGLTKTLYDFSPNFYMFIYTIIRAVFVFGLSSIYFTQPKIGKWGILGIILMAISFIGELFDGLSNFASLLGYLNILELIFSLPMLLLSPTSEISLSIVGYFIVGWLTIRIGMVPKWFGWLLLISGVITAIAYIMIFVLSVEFNSPLFIIGTLTEFVAYIGFGWYAIKHLKAE